MTDNIYYPRSLSEDSNIDPKLHVNQWRQESELDGSVENGQTSRRHSEMSQSTDQDEPVPQHLTVDQIKYEFPSKAVIRLLEELEKQKGTFDDFFEGLDPECITDDESSDDKASTHSGRSMNVATGAGAHATHHDTESDEGFDSSYKDEEVEAGPGGEKRQNLKYLIDDEYTTDDEEEPLESESCFLGISEMESLSIDVCKAKLDITETELDIQEIRFRQRQVTDTMHSFQDNIVDVLEKSLLGQDICKQDVRNMQNKINQQAKETDALKNELSETRDLLKLALAEITELKATLCSDSRSKSTKTPARERIPLGKQDITPKAPNGTKFKSPKKLCPSPATPKPSRAPSSTSIVNRNHTQQSIIVTHPRYDGIPARPSAPAPGRIR